MGQVVQGRAGFSEVWCSLKDCRFSPFEAFEGYIFASL